MMLKKIKGIILIGVLSVLLLPSIVDADVENSKKTVNGITYTIVQKSYNADILDETVPPYKYIYGILNLNKFVIYESGDLESEEEIYKMFENGSYRATDATAAEVINSRQMQWLSDEEDFYLEDFTDEDNNNKTGIFYDYYFLQHDRDNNCYIMTADLSLVEGKNYYTFATGIKELVTLFDSSKAHLYYEEVECNDYEHILKKTLSPEELSKLNGLIDSIKLSLTDKFNVHLRVYVSEMKDGYLYAISTAYTDEDILNPTSNDKKYIEKLYDNSLNEIELLADMNYFKYLPKAGLYITWDDTKYYIYDTNFNEIFSELYTNLPSDYAYVFEYDKNTTILDFEAGDYLLLTRYDVKSGENQTFSNTDLTITFTGDLSLLQKVKVNDVELAEENYTKASGSTIITLKNEYLSTLKTGTYTLKAEYADGGEVTANFIIPAINPQTGDSIIYLVLLGGVSIIVLLGISIYSNKKRYMF